MLSQYIHPKRVDTTPLFQILKGPEGSRKPPALLDLSGKRRLGLRFEHVRVGERGTKKGAETDELS